MNSSNCCDTPLDPDVEGHTKHEPRSSSTMFRDAEVAGKSKRMSLACPRGRLKATATFNLKKKN